MRIIDDYDDLTSDTIKEEFKKFIKIFLNPAFGSLPKREIELELFTFLRNVGLIDENSSIYELMKDLRVTRSKATQLLFDLSVRKNSNDDQLNNEIKTCITKTKFSKDGDYFVLEIENPFLLAHLKEMVRKTGHITDTSFNTQLARLSLDAITEVTDIIIPDNEKENIRTSLISAGAPDNSFKGVIKSSLKTLGKKFCGNAADNLVESSDQYLSVLLGAASEQVIDLWENVFSDNTESN